MPAAEQMHAFIAALSRGMLDTTGFRKADTQWQTIRANSLPLAKHRREDLKEAREAYLLEHTLGLKEHDAAQHKAFLQIEEDALARYPDPTPNDIAAAEAAEAALPSRKRTETQLRRSFEALAVHLPQDARRKRKSFVQRGQRAWNRANPTPLTSDLERTLTAAFMKAFGH